MRARPLAAVLMLATVCAACAQPAPVTHAARAEILVSIAPVERGTIRSEASFLGFTMAARQISVRAPAAGYLSDLTVQPGDRITRRQIVARLTTREETAARAGMTVARRLDPADQAEIAQAVHQYAAGAGIPVVAGAGGVVARRLASNGQALNEFDPILEVIDPRSIYVQAEVPVRLWGAIAPGRAVVVVPPDGTSAACQIAAILPGGSPAGQTFPIRITCAAMPAELMQVGIAVTVRVVAATRRDTLIIPAGALFVNPANQSGYVFILGADGRLHRRTIRLGLRNDTEVEALDGVRAGEELATSGGYALSDGLAARAAASAPSEAP